MASWCSYSEHREDQTVIHPAWPLRTSLPRGMLQGEEQQLPIATETVHWQQYRTNRDSLAPIHELIHQLESQGASSKPRSPCNTPIMASAKV